MDKLNEICIIICLGILIVDFIIWFIYHNKVKKYEKIDGERILYIAPSDINYNDEKDREYLIYKKNCNIEKVTVGIPFILVILELIIM